MTVTILCVGRMKEKPYRQMADEYRKRLSRFAKIEEIEVADLPEPDGSRVSRRLVLRLVDPRTGDLVWTASDEIAKE